MAHIIVVGAGIGGMTAAYDLRGKLSQGDHSITVIGDKPSFEFTPSNPWVAVGWRERSGTSIEVEKYLQKKKINFISSKVTNIDTDGNKLTLENGQSVDYDYLVITTGPKLAFDEIPGAGPEGGHT